MSQSLFHWCILIQDIPDSSATKDDRTVVVGRLPFTIAKLRLLAIEV